MMDSGEMTYGAAGRRSLSAHMIPSFVTLAILTAVAAGLPAVWLVGRELERQAWAEVEQASRAAQALYAGRESEAASLADLTAQRPTLQRLLAGGASDELRDYLRTLQSGARVDLLLVCNVQGRGVAGSGAMGDLASCPSPEEAGDVARVFYAVSRGSRPQPWLGSVSAIEDAAGRRLGVVVVGILLGDDFVAQMRAQTGLDHSVVWRNARLFSSLGAQALSTPPATPAPTGTAPGAEFALAGRPYYASRISLGTTGLEAEVALAVGGVAAAQRRLAWTLAGGVMAVAAVGSLSGAVLARRIGRPLRRLADVAAGLSTTDLDRPLAVETGVREVALVAHALEDARASLQRTLVELRQEKAWTDHLLESIVEGIVTLDRQGHITFFSQGAERITGWSRELVLGRSCDQVFQPVGSDEPFTQMIPAPGGRRKLAVELANGRQALLAVSGARLLPVEGGNARVALVFRDVSEEEAVHRLLGGFLANVAHEFKTPLSAVAASAELLLDQAPDLAPAEIQELLGALHLGILGLQTLIDNLLETASIETGHFRVYARPSQLTQIVEEAIRTMQPLLARRGQHLALDLPAAIPPVQADPRRTVQVLVNLLSNAAKHGPDGSEIVVRARAAGHQVRVSVADRGPGIPPEERERLFRRFARPATGNDQAKVGAGLGLSVVKAVIEAQGGQVGIDDRPGGGALFWFTLPVEGEL